MGNSYTNLIVHLIFHTKSGSVHIDEEHLSQVFHYIGGVIRAKSAHVFIVGGRPDHIHVLTTLPPSICMGELVRDIKSGSSKWIKSIDSRYKTFAWQEGYGAFSVSESNKNQVIGYIRNQKSHHQNSSMQNEFRLFLKRHGFIESLEDDTSRE